MEGVECVCFIFLPEYDAVLHARIIAKMVCSFSPFTQFWACNEASYPPFLSPLHPKTPPLHPCSDAWNTRFLIPQTTIWDIPFYLLGYIFGTFAHNVQLDFRFVFFVFAAIVCMFSFLSVHHVSSRFIWLDKIYFIILSSITLYYHGTIQGIRI